MSDSPTIYYSIYIIVFVLYTAFMLDVENIRNPADNAPANSYYEVIIVIIIYP